MNYTEQQQKRGKRSFLEGLGARENPYELRTDAYYNWLQGFTDMEREFPKPQPCGRCNDSGWLPEIEGSDGSYVTSRPCKCDAGDRVSRLS